MPDNLKPLSNEDFMADNSQGPKPLTHEQFMADQEPQRIPFTPVESAGLGAARGATFGYEPQIEGLVRGGYNALTSDQPTTTENVLAQYRKYRDQASARDQQAQSDNPKSYIAGSLAGAVGTGFIPGLGALNAGKEAGVAAKFGLAAAQGALAGGGYSNADLTHGQLEQVGQFGKDVAKGAGTGVLAQGALSAAGAAANALNPTEWAKKLSNIAFNTPEEVTQTYLDNPEGVRNASKMYEIAQNVKDSMQSLHKEMVSGSQASRQILSNEGASVTGPELAQIFRNKAQDITKRMEGVLSDPEKAAATKYLTDLANTWEQAPGAVSTNRVKDELQALDRTTDYAIGPNQFNKIDDQAKQAVRGEIDQLLKSKSPAYAQQMQQVASDKKLLNAMEEVAPSEKSLVNVYRRANTDQYGTGQLPIDTLQQFDQRMGTNYINDAKLAAAKQSFDNSVTNGSRNVQFYNNTFGRMPGGQIAAPLLGGAVDKYGKQMTMSAVDTAAKLNQVLNSQGVQAFKQLADPLFQAAQNGNSNAALTLYLLQRHNPQAIQSYNNQGAQQ